MEPENNKNTKKTAGKVGGLLFIGCLFIGMALGSYFDDMRLGLFGGLGVGFIVMAVAIVSLNSKK